MKELKPLELNKSLVMNEEYKKIITSAEKGKYSYYDYSREIIQEIANKNIYQLTGTDFKPIVQALFPEYLIYSGYWDNFLMYEIKNNERVDKPKCGYHYLNSYLDNDDEAKCNLLLEEIIDLFNKNDITPHESWLTALREIKVKYAEGK